MDSDSENENVSACLFFYKKPDIVQLLFIFFFQEFNPDFQFDFEVCVNHLSIHFVVLMFKIVQYMSRLDVMYGTRMHYSLSRKW